MNIPTSAAIRSMMFPLAAVLVTSTATAQTVLLDDFANDILLDPEFFSGAEGTANFWSANADFTESGGQLTIVKDNSGSFGSANRHSVPFTNEWDFFSGPIELQVRGISITNTGTANFPEGNMSSRFSFFSDGTGAFAADDGITVEIKGDGQVSLLSKVDTISSFGAIAFEASLSANSVTGFDLVLGPNASSGVDYSITVYHTGGTPVVGSGTLAINASDWSDGGTGDTSRLGTFIQESLDTADAGEEMTVTIGELNVITTTAPTSTGDSILLDFFANDVPRDPEFFSGVEGTTNFWSNNPDFTEAGGLVTVTRDNSGNFGSENRFSSAFSNEWDFFTKSIELQIRELSITNTGTVNFPEVNMTSRFGFFSDGFIGFSADDSIMVEITGSGRVRLNLNVDNASSWGSVEFETTLSANSVTGFDLLLGPNAVSGVDYTLTVYHTGGSPVLGTGTLAINASDWSDGGTGDSSRLGTYIQETVSGTSVGEEMTLTFGEINIITASAPTSKTFEQGVDSYAGTVDTTVWELNPDSSYGSSIFLRADGGEPGDVSQALIRFDDLFGNDPNQIPTDANILGATLTLGRDNLGGFSNTVSVSELLFSFDGNITWNSSPGGSGIQRDDVEASSTLLGTPGTLGASDASASFDVTSTIQSIAAGGTNYGWLITSDNTNNPIFIESSEGAADVSSVNPAPQLTVLYTSASNPPPTPAPSAPVAINSITRSGTDVTLNYNTSFDASGFEGVDIYSSGDLINWTAVGFVTTVGDNLDITFEDVDADSYFILVEPGVIPSFGSFDDSGISDITP